jgi:hypothetical protein
MKKIEEKHLYYLDELSDYKVDSHYSNVEGWKVKDREDRVIGEVSNLLVNKNLEKVVYLDVEVDESIIHANHDPYSAQGNSDLREFVNKKGENHIIIPIGMVTIDEKQKYVYANSIGYHTFAGTKRMTSGANINRDYEMMILDSYNRDRRTNNNDEDFERNQDYKQQYKKESPYRSDRRNEVDDIHRNDDGDRRNEDNDMDQTMEELKAERQSLKEERRKLENERLALKEERKKLQAERKRHMIDKNDTGNIGTDYENTNDFQNDGNEYPDDDSFYNRREFDRSYDNVD